MNGNLAKGNWIHYIEKPEDVLKAANKLAIGDLHAEGMNGRSFVEFNDRKTITDKFEKKYLKF